MSEGHGTGRNANRCQRGKPSEPTGRPPLREKRGRFSRLPREGGVTGGGPCVREGKGRPRQSPMVFSEPAQLPNRQPTNKPAPPCHFPSQRSTALPQPPLAEALLPSLPPRGPAEAPPVTPPSLRRSFLVTPPSRGSRERPSSAFLGGGAAGWSFRHGRRPWNRSESEPVPAGEAERQTGRPPSEKSEDAFLDSPARGE